jgi:FAD-dependent urate hydroxylase
MTQPRTALVVGGGVAGTVAAMALQRAGNDATVYEAHPSSDGEAGSYLTIAVNGLDALRAVDADAPVLAVGFPTPTNVLWSGTGKRLGTVSNGGALSDGTVSHTMKRARLHRAMEEEAARRASPSRTACGWSTRRRRRMAWSPASTTGRTRPLTCSWAPTGCTP